MRRFTTSLALAAATAITLLSTFHSPTAHADPYTYTNIADTSRSFTGFASQTAVNNLGQVAFEGFGIGSPLHGIFVGDGSSDPQLRVDNSSTSPFSDMNAPSINLNGTVAFQANLKVGGAGIYTVASDLTRTTIVQSDLTFNSFGAFPTINASGNVAFYATRSNSTIALYVGNGNSMTPYIDSTGIYNSFDTGPSIDDTDGITFIGIRPNGSQNLVYSQGQFNAIILRSSDTSVKNFGGGPTANAHGFVASLSNTTGSPSNNDISVYSIANQSSILVASTGNHLYAGLSDPTINAAGQVAFFGGTLDGKFGVFTGADPVENAVVVSGQPLFGSTVTNVRYVRGLSDNGEIPFIYTLANGRTGVALASPNAISRPVSAGDNYSDIRLHDGLGSGLLAQLRDGNASTDRTVDMAFTPNTGDFSLRSGTHLVGDTFTISGTDTDTFVLELTYTDADLLAAGITNESKLTLMWLDPSTNTLKNAVLGNHPVTPFNRRGKSFDQYSASVGGILQLGAYGNDPTTNTVWAIVNHNSTFALTDDDLITTDTPEPSTLLLLATAPALLLRRRPRHLSAIKPQHQAQRAVHFW